MQPEAIKAIAPHYAAERRIAESAAVNQLVAACNALDAFLPAGEPLKEVVESDFSRDIRTCLGLGADLVRQPLAITFLPAHDQFEQNGHQFVSRWLIVDCPEPLNFGELTSSHLTLRAYFLNISPGNPGADYFFPYYAVTLRDKINAGLGEAEAQACQVFYTRTNHMLDAMLPPQPVEAEAYYTVLATEVRSAANVLNRSV